VHAIKAFESGGTAPLIRTLGTGWMTMVALPHGKRPSYTLNRRINGPQIALSILEKKKNPFPVPEIGPRMLGFPAVSLVTIPIKLSRLSHAALRHMLLFPRISWRSSI
jgi:hypothetical protein